MGPSCRGLGDSRRPSGLLSLTSERASRSTAYIKINFSSQSYTHTPNEATLSGYEYRIEKENQKSYRRTTWSGLLKSGSINQQFETGRQSPQLAGPDSLSGPFHRSLLDTILLGDPAERYRALEIVEDG